jgi:hypothetical protein
MTRSQRESGLVENGKEREVWSAVSRCESVRSVVRVGSRMAMMVVVKESGLWRVEDCELTSDSTRMLPSSSPARTTLIALPGHAVTSSPSVLTPHQPSSPTSAESLL